MPLYLARLCNNGADWTYPTKSRQYRVSPKNYHTRNGFGHEEWLFRLEWLIDGWRYGFVEGVNRSHRRLAAEKKPFDLILFEIDIQGCRRYVARIENVECLKNADAKWAVAEFDRRGWLRTMEGELQAAGANVSALGNSSEAHHILCLRFRPENCQRFTAAVFATSDDPILGITRFNLNDLSKIEAKDLAARRKRLVSQLPPVVRPYMRQGAGPLVCSPDHARMQAELMHQLQQEYPAAKITRESGWVDVSVHNASEILLFEIKSDLDPCSVIRQALGQILEYAYHPSRHYDRPVRLFIVGRNALNKTDRAYLNSLRANFGLPIEYRTVSI